MDIQSIIEQALSEDIGSGDITTGATVPAGKEGKAVILAREEGIISGLDIARQIFLHADAALRMELKVSEGNRVFPNTELMHISGQLASILQAERVALNFLGRLSGISTQTAKFVAAVEGTGCNILDTRKTTPLLRELEKYAVRVGGGMNHRMGLYDMYLVKENHIAAAGGIEDALKKVFAYRQGKSNNAPVEIEVRNFEELRKALNFPVERILLDNMSVKEIAEAVKICAGKAQLEVSGGINLENVRRYALTGVDFISVGKLTHSAASLDVSLLVVGENN
ncbi:MAG: carboxylating nicotinate-nucleotide diphosphorylase [Calditrichia bacterium]